MRYSLVKVLLTVSPFGSLLPPNPECFRSFSNFAPIHSTQVPHFYTLTNSWSLIKKLTPLQSIKSELFCQNTGVGYLLRQLRGWRLPRGGGVPSQLSLLVDFLPLCFHILTNPFFRNSFPCTSMQNPRGVGPQYRWSSAVFRFLLGRRKMGALNTGTKP